MIIYEYDHSLNNRRSSPVPVIALASNAPPIRQAASCPAPTSAICVSSTCQVNTGEVKASSVPTISALRRIGGSVDSHGTPPRRYRRSR